MLDHVSIPVADIAGARAFYDAALAPLGFKRMMNFDAEAGNSASGYGTDHPWFWIGREDSRKSAAVSKGSHIAFRAPSRDAVDAFYEAAIAAGAKDNGAPGLRANYHPNYYAAFVFDLDGHHIEAVCHQPEAE
jgi:catechol 2,3-dioxygenase-like lactoylglutathione lyase family enzyme